MPLVVAQEGDLVASRVHTPTLRLPARLPRIHIKRVGVLAEVEGTRLCKYGHKRSI